MDQGQVREYEAEMALVHANIEATLAPDAAAAGEELHTTKTWSPAKSGQDLFSTCFNRRAFMKAGATLLSSLAISYPLQEFQARRLYGAAIPNPYGPLIPAVDAATGLTLVALPEGFRYTTFAWVGDPISGGLRTPNNHDGMAVVRQIGSRVILVRNHEVANGAAFAGGAIRHSPGAGGGNINLMFNLATEQLENSWATLSGTFRNCAGGLTPWGTWLSGEESVVTTSSGGVTYTHGWMWDVPALGSKAAQPLTAMGRFAHEAAVVNPATGIVYQTEDNGTNSGFYRFLPNVNGNMAAGGVLQMLKIKNASPSNLTGNVSLGGTLFTAGQTWDTEWVTIANPTSTNPSCFTQGLNQGGARFRRLEGCWFASGKVYFLSTDGGEVREGTVFAYDPAAETLEMIFDIKHFEDCDNPDNMVVTPRGGFILCEDAAGGQGNVAAERLVGLTPNGETFTFLDSLVNFSGSGLGTYTRPNNPITFRNDERDTEWAGACFSPDGKWLFVNHFMGITFAITGPWESGPL